MQDINLEKQLSLLHKKIKDWLNVDCPYAMLLIALSHFHVRGKQTTLFCQNRQREKILLIRVVRFRVGREIKND